MPSIISIFILILILFLALKNIKTLQKTTQSISLKVEGMTCSHCESNVVKALMSIKGFKKVMASYDTGEVIIESENFDISKVKKALDSFNYKVIEVND